MSKTPATPSSTPSTDLPIEVRLRGDQPLQLGPMRLQDRPAVAAIAGRRRAPGRPHPLHQLDRRRRADRKPPRRGTDRAPSATASTIRRRKSIDSGAGMASSPVTLNQYCRITGADSTQ